MTFLTEAPFLIGVIITLCAIAISFSVLKPDKSQLKGIKEWVTRDDWSGDVIIVTALNWCQNDTKYGDEYFYTFYYNATIYGVKKRYSAMCAVKSSQIHKIKKGIKISVKYSCGDPPKMAVINLE